MMIRSRAKIAEHAFKKVNRWKSVACPYLPVRQLLLLVKEGYSLFCGLPIRRLCCFSPETLRVLT